VADHVYNPRPVYCLGHSLCLRDSAGQRLLAKNGFALGGGGDRNLRMRSVRGGDIDEIDLRVAHDPAPIRGTLFPVEDSRRFAHRPGAATADDTPADRDWQIEKPGRLSPGVGVGPAMKPRPISPTWSVRCAGMEKSEAKDIEKRDFDGERLLNVATEMIA